MTIDDLLQRAQVLTNPDQVDAFFRDHPIAVLFKAGTCHRTDDALADLAAALNGRSAPPIGLIRVVDARAASERVAQITRIRHESPQVLLLRNGQAVFARDNWGITEQALRQAFDANLDSTSRQDE